MTLRELTTVGLRILAVVCIVVMVSNIPSEAFQVYLMMTRPGGVSVPRELLIAQIVPEVVALGVAVILFVTAPFVARLVCWGLENGGESSRIETIRAGDLYHIGAFLAGVYALVRATGPASRAIVAMMELSTFQSYAPELTEAIVLVVVAGALILGAKGLAAFVSSLGHDPNKVPALQFSVRVVLFATAGIAILLVVIRALTR